MILTSEYRAVLAAFNSPVGFKLTHHSPGFYQYTFTVWPFEYRADLLTMGDGKRQIWDINFALRKVIGTGEELHVYLERIFNKKIDITKLPLYIKKIEERPVKDTNFGQEKQIFSTLIQIIGELIKKEDPSCFSIGSPSVKKFGVYKSLARRYLPGWEILSEGGSNMTICQQGAS